MACFYLNNSYFSNNVDYFYNNIDESDNSSETFKKEFNRVFNVNSSYYSVKDKEYYLDIKFKQAFNEIMTKMRLLSKLSLIDKTKLQLQIIKLLLKITNKSKHEDTN
jgi:hypothetical protein